MSGGRGIVAAGRRKPPARRRQAGPTVPCRPPPHRYHDFDDWIARGNDLVAYYAALVDCIESLEAADAKPSKPWLWSERPEARLKRRLALGEAAQALLARFSAAELDAAVAEFGAGWRWFERDDNYEGPEGSPSCERRLRRRAGRDAYRRISRRDAGVA
jgi:hypothetical protein